MYLRLTAYFEHIRQLIALPDGRVVAIAALVCAVPFLAGIAFVTPSYFATSFHKLVARSVHDVRLFGYADAVALSLDQTKEGKIVLVGASSMRAAFDNDIMEDELLNITGLQIPVYNLAVDGQTIMELISMVEHIPEGSTGKLFVKVSPISMTKDYFEASMRLALESPDRLTLQTPILAQEMKMLGIRDSWTFGNFFLDNIVFFCGRYKNIVLNTLRNKRFDFKHVYMDKEQVSQDRWNLRGIGVKQSISTYDDNKEANFQYIRSLVAYTRQKTSMEIVLVEQLYNPRLSQEFFTPSFYVGYEQDITNLANSLNVRYLNLPDQLNFDANVFYDWTHINSATAINQASRQLIKATHSDSTVQEQQ